MADESKPRRSGRQRDEIERRSAEIERLGPFVELAREIQLEVDRIAEDDTAADVDSLTEALDRIPRQERQRVTLAVFDRLPAEVQWAVLERAFDDAEIREHLAAEHERRRTALALGDELGRIARAARSAGQLEIASLPSGAALTLGLFREADARAAVHLGRASDSCARQLVLRVASEHGLRVIEDVFNPRGGYFVTRDYDEQTWQGERLAPHALVGVGALTGGPTPSFEAVLYPAGRVDFTIDTGPLQGRLHLGFVILGDIDVFAG